MLGSNHQGGLQDVPLNQIDLADTRFQLRAAPPQVSDIRRSFEAEGQEEPVELLGPSPYRIIDGFRRCTVATALGWKTIQALVHEGMSEAHAFRKAFTANVVRRNLTSLDKANAMRIGMKQGMTVLDLAAELNLSEKQVRRYLDLLKIPEAIRNEIDDHFVTMSHALVLAEFSVGNVEQVAQDVRERKLSVGQLRQFLTKRLGAQRGRPPRAYIRREGATIRGRAFRIKLDAPVEERERLVAALLEAAALLQRGITARFSAAETRLEMLRAVQTHRTPPDRNANSNS